MDRHARSTRMDQAPDEDSCSENFPARSRNKSLDLVPQGTVALRVQSIQGLSDKISPKIRLNLQNHSRENSSIRFGCRSTRHFCQPAQRNTRPNEEIDFKAKHSFTGLKVSKVKYDEDSNVLNANKGQNSLEARKREKFSVPGLNLPVERPNPFKIFSQISSRSAGVNRTSPHIDTTSKETDSTNSQNTSAIKNLNTLPDLCIRKCSRLQYDEETTSQRRDSNSSISTSSTLRRQSVRDLFIQHGVRRPFGLASSTEPDHDVKQNYQEPNESCQCSRMMKHYSGICSKCRYHLNSYCGLIQKQELSPKPIREFEDFNVNTQKKHFPELDTQSFIRKSQRSNYSPSQFAGTHFDRMLMPKMNTTSKTKPLSKSNSLRSSKISRENDSETSKVMSLFSCRNLTTNVEGLKESPRFSNHSGVPPLAHHNSQVASKKLSYESLQLDNSRYRNNNFGPTILRHCASYSQALQRQNFQKTSDKKFWAYECCHDPCSNLEIDPQHDSVQSDKTHQKTSLSNVSTEDLKNQSKADVGNDVNIIDEPRPLKDINPLLNDEKRVHSSATCDQFLLEKSSWSHVEEQPAIIEPTDGFKVLSRAKSAIFRRNSKLSRIRSTSSCRTKMLDTNGKHMILSFPRNTIGCEGLKFPGSNYAFQPENPGNFSSKSDLHESEVETTLETQIKSLSDKGKSGRDQKQRKKQRRPTIANRIKRGFSHSIDRKRSSLERQNSEVKSDSNFYITDLNKLGPPSQKFTDGRWVDLPPINLNEDQGLWNHTSETSPSSVAAQDIRGVTVTLQLEGREDMVFRAEPWESEGI